MKKTTILEAISELREITPTNLKYKWIPKDRVFNFTDDIIIQETLELDEYDIENIQAFSKENGFKKITIGKTYTRKLISKFKDSTIVEAESGYISDFSLSAIKKNGQLQKIYEWQSDEFMKLDGYIQSELRPPIIYYPNFLFDFPDRIYLEKQEGESKEQETYRKVINDIVDSFTEDIDVEDHIIQRLKVPSEANKEALESTVEKVADLISKTVFNAWGELFKSHDKSIVITPGLDKNTSLPYIDIRIKQGLNKFRISERSLGFKWFFTFLLFTEFRKNRLDDNGEILFLLDEPASNLHSTAQKNLLTTFDKLAEDCHLIYTTHSHHLINPRWLSGAYIVRNKSINYDNLESDENKTDIHATIYKQFVSKHPEQKTYFQPILDAIEYSPSMLEEVPNIVLTEGKNDYYTFLYINDIILKKKYKGLKFYPGNGADRNNQIIATYLAWGRDFLILLDGDKPGEDAKKRYLKEFGVVLQRNIITLKDVDPSFSFATEKLFTASEQMMIIQTFDNAAKVFDKSKFNTALQNLFIQEQNVELSKETIERFKKLFDFIK